MATIVRDGDVVRIELSSLEKVEAIHGDLAIPVESIEQVEIVHDILTAVHGLRVPGTSIPGVMAVGTFISRDGKSFLVIHHGEREGVRLTLKGMAYGEVLIGNNDPDDLVAQLSLG
jgi:hypothetical protein